MYIMSAVMNQSAPYQKDQFLLRFYILICYAILYFLEKRSVATHISLFYSLRNIFSIVRVQEDILFEKAKTQNRELGFLKIITKTYTLLYMDLSATYKWKDDYFLWLRFRVMLFSGRASWAASSHRAGYLPVFYLFSRYQYFHGTWVTIQITKLYAILYFFELKQKLFFAHEKRTSWEVKMAEISEVILSEEVRLSANVSFMTYFILKVQIGFCFVILHAKVVLHWQMFLLYKSWITQNMIRYP